MTELDAGYRPSAQSLLERLERGLIHTALLGLAGFVALAICGVIVMRTDRPLAALGRAAQSLWNKVTRGRRPVTGLDQRCTGRSGEPTVGRPVGG